MMIWMYTDGSVSRPTEGNSPGGWAFSFRLGDEHVKRSGCSNLVTSNQMEMVAAVQGLQELLRRKLQGTSVCIVSDSQYLVQGASLWMISWKRNRWRNGKGRSLKNKELWMQIDYLANQFNTRWKWVRGHTGNPDNEAVDKLARSAAFRSSGLMEAVALKEPLDISPSN